ncbi:MAG: SDR family oxidoreductase [Anaerolineales bacterium]|nr:SDR family oxidoreductase [Anaerolineales bacterium]
MIESPVILITGAAGNLGAAVVRAFALTGARLALAERHPERMETVAREAGLSTEQVLITPVDITDAASVTAWVEAVRARWGRADGLINVAGAFKAGKPVHEMEEADWDFMHNINAKAAFLTCRAVVPLMLENGGGKIVNVSARAGLAGGKNSAAYGASKAAVLRLTESLSAELREKNINVNAVLPSIIDTPQNRAAMPTADAARWVTPEDLASVIVFLASEQARAIHGALIPVYGLS